MRTNKKIVYFGHLQLADADFSYLHEAQKLVDMNYYMETTPIYMNGPALSINKLYQVYSIKFFLVILLFLRKLI